MSDSPKMRDGIVKRGSTYSYVVRVRDQETGKTKPEWHGGFPTAKDAKLARDTARVASGQGTFVPRRNVTVRRWLDDWLTVHKSELKPSTIASYRSKIDSYLIPTIGRTQLRDLSPMGLGLVFASLAESGGKDGLPLSPRTVQYVRAILRKALNDAVTERVIPLNPVIGSKSPKVAKPAHVTWDTAQQKRFLEGVEGSRWFTVWRLAFATGMRRGELCGLRWSAVDLDEGLLQVERSATQIGRDVVTTTPKNDEPRPVAVDPVTVAALRSWRKQQTMERLQWGPGWVNPDDLVFTWQDGSRVLPDYLSKTFLAEQRGLGLPRMTLHGTRHTHATTLLRAGEPVHVVAKRLGHQDPSVTLRVYADAVKADDDRAVDAFVRALGE